jgi:hypothetical protein
MFSDFVTNYVSLCVRYVYEKYVYKMCSLLKYGNIN